MSCNGNILNVKKINFSSDQDNVETCACSELLLPQSPPPAEDPPLSVISPVPCCCCPAISAILRSICSKRSRIDILNWLSAHNIRRSRVTIKCIINPVIKSKLLGSCNLHLCLNHNSKLFYISEVNDVKRLPENHLQ